MCVFDDKLLFRNMMRSMYSINDMDIKVEARNQTGSMPVQGNITDIFIMPNGLCQSIELNLRAGQTEVMVDLGKPSNYNAFLIYPEMLKNGLNIIDGGNIARITVSQNDHELASLYNVKLSSTVKSQDVADCTPDRSQYTECVVGRVKKDMMNLLGCLPPWVEQSADTCTKSVPYNHTLHKEISLHTEDLISGNTKAVQCRQESKI